MRKFYQTEWHRIPFSQFSTPNRNSLPGDEFYRHFYEVFFSTYSSYENLDESWIEEKKSCASFLAEQLKSLESGDVKEVLSIGCGIGAIEKSLFEQAAEMGLVLKMDVVETSPIPFRWLQRIGQSSLKFNVGYFPDCLSPDQMFDCIYMVAFDYCFDEAEWVGFLEKVRCRLKPRGKCIVISASLELEQGFGRKIKFELKELIKAALENFGMRPPTQFWGWQRSCRDYRESLKQSGFESIHEGRIEGERFWIIGQKQ